MYRLLMGSDEHTGPGVPSPKITRFDPVSWIGVHPGTIGLWILTLILEPSIGSPISVSLFNNWKEVVECLIVTRRSWQT